MFFAIVIRLPVNNDINQRLMIQEMLVINSVFLLNRPTIALSLVVYLFQILSAKFVFLQNKDTGIAVNNRSVKCIL